MTVDAGQQTNDTVKGILEYFMKELANDSPNDISG